MSRYFGHLFCAALLSYSSVIYSAATLEQGLLAYQQGDLGLAQRIFEPLAEAGDTKAQFYLSVVHRRRFPPQTERSLFWLKRAAASDYLPAQFNLGSYYHKTQPASQDLQQSALYWWQRAAQAGYDRAQFNLAKLYAVGDNLPQDLAKARYWYQKAADQGMQRASDALEILQEESLKAALENQQLDPVEHEISTVFLPAESVSGTVALAGDEAQSPVQPILNDETQIRVAAENLKLDENTLNNTIPDKNTLTIPAQTQSVEHKTSGDIPIIELDWAQQQVQTHYTIQLAVFNAVQKCQNQALKLLHKHQLTTQIVSRLKNGIPLCYLLHGSYATKKKAHQRVTELQKSLKYWIRPINSLPPASSTRASQNTTANIKPVKLDNNVGWLMQQPAQNVTIQFHVFTEQAKCQQQALRLLKKYQLKTHIIRASKSASAACYVIYGSFAKKYLAKRHIAALPKSLNYWIRPIQGLQDMQIKID